MAGRSLSSQVAWTTASKVAVPLSALLTGPLLARALGPVDRGTFSAILIPVTFVAMVGSFGVPEATTYLVARRRAPERQLLRIGLLLGLATGVLSGAGMWLLAPAILHKAPESVDLMRAMCVLVPIAMTMGAVRGLALGRGHFGVVNSERWIGIGLRLPLLFGFAAVGALTLERASWITYGSGLLAMMVLWTVVRDLPATRERRRGVPREMASYGSRAWGGTIADYLLLRLDQVLLAPLAGPLQLGFYAVAVSLAEVPRTFQGATRDVLFTSATDRSDPHLVAQGSRTVVALSVASAAVGILLAPVVLPLMFGSSFNEAVPMAQVLLIGTTPAGAQLVLSAGLLSVGRPGQRSLATLVGLVCNVVLLLLLVAEFGGVGAAWASVAANCVAFAITAAYFVRATAVSLRDCVVPSRSDLRGLWQRFAAVLRRQDR